VTKELGYSKDTKPQLKFQCLVTQLRIDPPTNRKKAELESFIRAVVGSNTDTCCKLVRSEVTCLAKIFKRRNR